MTLIFCGFKHNISQNNYHDTRSISFTTKVIQSQEFDEIDENSFTQKERERKEAVNWKMFYVYLSYPRKFIEEIAQTHGTITTTKIVLKGNNKSSIARQICNYNN